MKKWQSNLCVAILAIVGLQLVSEDLNRYFYQVPVTKEESAPISTDSKAKSKDYQVQVVTKNDTITSESKNGTATDVAMPTDGKMTLVVLNSMDASALEQINGVGPVLAKRILEYRQKNGPFQSLDELNKVKGIGPKKLAKIKTQFAN